MSQTQLEAARGKIVTPEMQRVAVRESRTPEFIRDEVARGRLVIYTGIPFTDGQSPFHGAVAEILGERHFVCEELEVDVLGDELAGESYGRIDRLGVVALIVDGDHS